MSMMKKVTALCLSVLLLAPTVLAGTTGTLDKPRTFAGASAWAQEDLKRADSLGLVHGPHTMEAASPMIRAQFGEHAAGLVAKVFGQDLGVWEAVCDFRTQSYERLVGNTTAGAILAHELGILLGRGGDNLDGNGKITRQEAAVMLARAYGLYGEEIRDVPATTYADQSQVAAWAREAVALMAQLGIMEGVGGSRFDPLGTYTVEQCIVTVLRLYEKTGQETAKEDPMGVTAQEKIVARHWDQSLYFTGQGAMEGKLVYTTRQEGLPHGDAISQLCYLDEAGHFKTYPVTLETRPGRDAKAYAPNFAYEGARLSYRVDLPEIKDADGKVLYREGTYEVLLDPATGKETVSWFAEPTDH